MWLHMNESDLDRMDIKDQHLRLTLAFGIGMHHAGLVERDRKTVEELFVNQKIQVCVANYWPQIRSYPVPTGDQR